MPIDSTPSPAIREPWLGFLLELDAALDEPLEIHCIGGFALTVLAELPRPTGDVDVITVLPTPAHDELIRVAGDGSELDRGSARDREDLRFLADAGLLQARILKERYERELRPFLLNESRASLTLELWLEELFGKSAD